MVRVVKMKVGQTAAMSVSQLVRALALEPGCLARHIPPQSQLLSFLSPQSPYL